MTYQSANHAVDDILTKIGNENAVSIGGRLGFHNLKFVSLDRELGGIYKTEDGRYFAFDIFDKEPKWVEEQV